MFSREVGDVVVGGAFQSSTVHTILMRYTVGMTDMLSQAILIEPQEYYKLQIDIKSWAKMLSGK